MIDPYFYLTFDRLDHPVATQTVAGTENIACELTQMDFAGKHFRQKTWDLTQQRPRFLAYSVGVKINQIHVSGQPLSCCVLL